MFHEIVYKGDDVLNEFVNYIHIVTIWAILPSIIYVFLLSTYSDQTFNTMSIRTYNFSIK